MDPRSSGLGRRSTVGIAVVALGMLAALAALATVGGCGGCGKKTDASESTSSAATAASGAATYTAGPPGLPDVCKMFSNDEMGALIGGKITVSKAGEKSTATEPECDWLDQNEGIAVSISLAPAPKDLSFAGYDPVTGIGEAAAENHGILSVLYRGTEITVIHGGSGHVEIQKKIAAKVIEALDKKKQGH